MISCTEFIFAYSELFKFIEKNSGRQAVTDYWEYISDTFVEARLGRLIDERGLRGCWDYWSKSLNEEAADFRMRYDGDKGEFEIDMLYCPSKGRLLENPGMKPYDNYCGHCDLLYRRPAEARGLRYEYDMSGVGEAKCVLRITDPAAAGKNKGKDAADKGRGE